MLSKGVQNLASQNIIHPYTYIEAIKVYGQDLDT